MATWFTSDTHFGSERTLQLSKRPFESITEMDEEMIRRWNSKVAPGDEVFHLGDFGDLDVIKRLNGEITLIEGNYERRDDYDRTAFRQVYTHPCLRYCFVHPDVESRIELADNETSIEALYGDFALVHEPSHSDFTWFTLYGHVHGQKFKRNGLNVGVDCHHFYPVSLEDVFFYRDAVQLHYDDEVFHPGLTK